MEFKKDIFPTLLEISQKKLFEKSHEELLEESRIFQKEESLQNLFKTSQKTFEDILKRRSGFEKYFLEEYR